jgi:hypothetical protein
MAKVVESLRNKLIKRRSTGLNKRKEKGEESPSAATAETVVSDCSDSCTSRGYTPNFEPESPGKYGYGDATSDGPPTIPRRLSSPTPTPRRYSAFSTPRRSSTSQTSRRHSTSQTPRRSSMKGSAGPRPKRRSSIEFSEDIQITPIVPATDLIEDKSDLWLQDKDYKEIMARSYNLVAKAVVSQGTKKKFCTRGLEKFKGDKLKNYFESYQAILDTVLDEQDFQWDAGIADDEAMSEVYMVNCLSSRMKARQQAEQDEKAVRKYLKDTRNMCHRC